MLPCPRATSTKKMIINTWLNGQSTAKSLPPRHTDSHTHNGALHVVYYIDPNKPCCYDEPVIKGLHVHIYSTV